MAFGQRNGARWGFLERTERQRTEIRGQNGRGQKSERSSLKELFLSRAAWRIFCVPSARKPFRAFFCLRIWFRSLIDTVMLSRLLCRSFPCGSTPIHPFVDTPAFRGSRSGPVMNLTPDYSAATVSSALGRLNQRDARQARLSPLTSSDWPLRWRGPLPGQEGPMQPSRLIPFPLDSSSRGSR